MTLDASETNPEYAPHRAERRRDGRRDFHHEGEIHVLAGNCYYVGCPVKAGKRLAAHAVLNVKRECLEDWCPSPKYEGSYCYDHVPAGKES